MYIDTQSSHLPFKAGLSCARISTKPPQLLLYFLLISRGSGLSGWCWFTERRLDLLAVLPEWISYPNTCWRCSTGFPSLSVSLSGRVSGVEVLPMWSLLPCVILHWLSHFGLFCPWWFVGPICPIHYSAAPFFFCVWSDNMEWVPSGNAPPSLHYLFSVPRQCCLNNIVGPRQSITPAAHGRHAPRIVGKLPSVSMYHALLKTTFFRLVLVESTSE